MTSKRTLFITVFLLALITIEAAPFFDAIYDAINGNGRRSYGYSGYNYPSYGYNGDYGYGYAQPSVPRRGQRKGKSWKEICRVHFPQSVGQPGHGGITCPY